MVPGINITFDLIRSSFTDGINLQQIFFKIFFDVVNKYHFSSALLL